MRSIELKLTNDRQQIAFYVIAIAPNFSVLIYFAGKCILNVFDKTSKLPKILFFFLLTFFVIKIVRN